MSHICKHISSVAFIGDFRKAINLPTALHPLLHLQYTGSVKKETKKKKLVHAKMWNSGQSSQTLETPEEVDTPRNACQDRNWFVKQLKKSQLCLSHKQTQYTHTHTPQLPQWSEGH